MIRGLIGRLRRPADRPDESGGLRAEVDRLRLQNQKMRRAMRHCIDCEYRVEVMAARADEGRSASGDGPRS